MRQSNFTFNPLKSSGIKQLQTSPVLIDDGRPAVRDGSDYQQLNQSLVSFAACQQGRQQQFVSKQNQRHQINEIINRPRFVKTTNNQKTSNLTGQKAKNSKTNTIKAPTETLFPSVHVNLERNYFADDELLQKFFTAQPSCMQGFDFNLHNGYIDQIFNPDNEQDRGDLRLNHRQQKQICQSKRRSASDNHPS